MDASDSERQAKPSPTPPRHLGPADLRRACRAAARGKRRRPAIARFLVREDAELAALALALNQGCYRPLPGRSFWIEDPKRRCIFALPFRDRVVQHLLIGATLPLLERRLRAQTYACRPGLGTHRCLHQAARWFRARAYVLRVDIRKFFPSIDHALLRRQLQASTPPPWRWLRDRFLDAPIIVERADFYFPGDDLLTPLQRPHGLPIGSLTSQLWANSYLSPLDDLLACELGLGSFVRYCDDLLLFDDDPGRLCMALERISACATRLRLRLHPIKTRLHRTSDPVRFLSFVLRRTPRDRKSVV